jgi:hypothetical protein
LSIRQERIIDKLKKKYKNLNESVQWTTPSAPNFFVVRPRSKAEMIPTEEQKDFRSIIGTLLYLVKLSRPDIANPVRELSKVMDGAAPGHEKELKRLCQFVIQTRERKLNIKTSKDVWVIEAYSDSDFAGDKDERKSITGYIIYLSGAPISWKSKAQSCVTLSSTEAEYVALNETVREVKFIFQLLTTMGINVRKPAKINVDNIGCIFLANNKTSGERTKHINMKFHFIREQIQNGLVEVKFVKSEENHADPFTKNLGSEKFNFHSKIIMEGKG